MFARESAVREQRLQLRAEDERAVGQQRVVQRLDAEPVAREEQRLRGCGPRARTRTCRGSARRSRSPHASQAWTMTSVSLWVRKRWPSAGSSGIS